VQTHACRGCREKNREATKGAIANRCCVVVSLRDHGFPPPDVKPMSATPLFRSAANIVYRHGFPVYRALYGAYKAYSDRMERAFLRKVLFQGAVIADVGANIGIYSSFLARCAGASGVVHAFEPSPDNFRHLLSVTRRFPNVRAVQAAVGERTGACQLYISETLNVDHRTYRPEGDSRRAIETKIVALDDYFKPGQRVDLIKMDIQGYELHALRGARRVVADNPAIAMLLEFWPYGLSQAGVSWSDLVSVLGQNNLSVWRLLSNGLTLFQPPSVPEEDVDWYISLFAFGPAASPLMANHATGEQQLETRNV
jgi:FkbM family methyltransferase